MNVESKSKKDRVRDYFSEVSLPDFGVDSRFFPAMGKRLVELADIPLGSIVLDVAAGRGASLFPAAEKVGDSGHVTGIDLAEGMVKATTEEIRQRGIQNVSMLEMDAERLDFPSKTFDRVLCGFAIFFFPGLDQALREFFRVLKPGGVLAASTFGKEDEQLDWYEELRVRYGISRGIPVSHALDMPEILRDTFSKTGFNDIQIVKERFDSVYLDEEDWWSHLWSTADRKALESISENQQEAFKNEAFRQVQAFKREKEVHIPYHVLFTLGTRPFS